MVHVFRKGELHRHGMVFQTDVIPGNPTYFSTRMEDGLAIADAPHVAALKAGRTVPGAVLSNAAPSLTTRFK